MTIKNQAEQSGKLHMWPREGEIKTLNWCTHEGGNFKEMLTYDKPCVVCIWGGGLHLCDPTNAYTQWVTHLLSRYAGDVFLFLAQIEFPVPRFSSPRCSATQLPVSWSGFMPGSAAYVTQTLVIKCWLQEPVTGSERTEDARKTYREFETAKSLWCSAIDLKGYRRNCWLEIKTDRQVKSKFITTKDAGC